ncbi:adenine-specific DNA-methyltransferase [Arthrobacter sp. PvP023]|uniref:site-specific DNA-methyltransferase n=1 Tax=Micrococcaceae TaxID=1268 RepID=UPI001B58A905|nr:site-specific DNA-methyltransferase [Arthrobacter sp. PvP023]MBP1137315.1 adenine-specific DNA-methyltransferase [Arthrobacter sp. PvP023]
MTSPNLTDANIEKLAELFPSVVTETTDDDGNPTQAVDFDLLRQELSDHVVDGPQERYRLDWPGKRAAAFAANAPIAKTLRPVRQESVDFDTTKNLFIEGDNLDALKLLQESYLGKIKVIFADPPYNTGSDLVYEDDFSTSTGDYLLRSGELDERGRLNANPLTNGRFHSDWLTMMYPRLRLARTLLSDDGVIFVTIGDQEGANLRVLMDEIFGVANFIATIVWQSRTSISDDQEISANHNYVLAYARDRGKLSFWGEPLRSDEYSNSDNDSRGPWKLVPLDANKPGGDTNYEVVNPDTGQGFWPPAGRSWAINPRSMQELIADNRVKFGLKGDSAPKRKLYLNERIQRGDTRTPSSLLLNAGTTKDGSEEVAKILGGKKIFDYPKPVSLLTRLVGYGASGAKDCTVLDFFAGSGTTADAVMQLNLRDGGSRRFIVVQYPEKVDPATPAAKAGYETIADVARERIRRSGALASDKAGLIEDAFDIGFRALKVDTTNMADVLRSPDETGQLMLGELESSVKADRSGEDLLFQVLLDWGLELTMPIAIEQIEGHEVFIVEDGALAACFGSGITPNLVRTIAKREPLRAVFRDAGFASDDARINAEQIFHEMSPATEVKAL